MVVNGLDEYISVKCKHCLKSQPICPKPGTLYVIDGASFVSHVIKQTSWVFGGQWKEIKDIVEKFVESMIREGCDIVVIMPHWADVLSATDLKNIKQGLEFISINQLLPTTIDFYQNPPCSYFVVAQILKAIRVEVLCSVDDFEFEVAAWAKLKNCTGIISDNNEFVALKGVPCFRLSSLNTENHTIEYIDRHLLTKNVGLKEPHLPLLSCLLGNSLIPLEMLYGFHKKLHSGLQSTGLNPVLDIMPRICMYVRPQNTQFHMLARTVLSDPSKAEFLQAIVKRYNLSSVEESWKPYQLPEDHVTYNSIQIYEDAVTSQLRCESIPFIYGVLKTYLYEQGVTLEHNQTTSSFDLYRPQRKSCYSIILGSDASVTEKCIGSELAMETVPCEIFTTKERIVSLDALHRQDKDSFKWATFVKCAHVTFDKTLACQLPPQFLGLCSILNYMWHSPLIHLAQWELNAFLAQAVSQYAANITTLRRILVTVVNVRATTLSVQLARGAEALFQIAAVTGLPVEPFLLYNYFDGKLFSFYYYLADKGATVEQLCDDMPDRIEMFNFLLMVIQSKNLSIGGDAEEDSEDEATGVKVAEEANVSIVPEYEAISEDEKEGDCEPVFEEEEGDPVGLVTNGTEDKAESNGAAAVEEVQPIAASEEANSQTDVVPVEDTPSASAVVATHTEHLKSYPPRLTRKDSTGGAVNKMRRLKMTNSTVFRDSTCSSFFGAGLETTPPLPSPTLSLIKDHYSNLEDDVMDDEVMEDEQELVPPGLEPEQEPEEHLPAPVHKARIPLPALPGSCTTPPLFADPLNFNDEQPLTPIRLKRLSDKENVGLNKIIEQPIKRHKSEET